jgi:hypothetical protein
MRNLLVCIQMLHYTMSKRNTDDKLSNFTLNKDGFCWSSVKPHQISYYVSWYWHVPLQQCFPTFTTMGAIAVTTLAGIKQTIDFSSTCCLCRVSKRKVKGSTTKQSKVPQYGSTSIDPHSCEMLTEQFCNRCPKMWWCRSCWKTSTRNLWHSIFL